MKRKIRFAIVGFGHIGHKHSLVVNQFGESELMAIVDTDPSVKDSPHYPAQIPFFDSIEALFSALKGGIDLDVLTIATPNGLHASQAITGLRHNCHVLIEKPMALSKTECEDIIYTALQYSKQVFVVKQNRYSPPSKWLKDVVSQGHLGKVQMVQINCYWNRDDRYYKPGGWKGTLAMDGGTLFTQFSHFVDILYWIFGDIKNIHAQFNNFTHQHSTEFEDSGVVQFELVKGGLGCINYSTAIWDANLESSITVTGEKGSLKIGGQYMNEVLYCHVKDYTMPELAPTNPPNDYGPFKGSAANHHYVIENVVNTLNGADQITANALEGMKVVDIIERVYQIRKQKHL